MSSIGEPAAERQPLAGRVAVVTGASSGIGRAVALRLASDGSSVALFARSREKLQETAETIRHVTGAEPLIFSGDVMSEVDVSHMVGETLRCLGTIDILVAAAAIGRPPGLTARLPLPLAETPTDQWDIVLATNLTGIFLCNRAVLPAMIAVGGGDIVNISSARGGLRGEPLASAYCASKFGVIGFSEALRAEVGSHGVRVSTVLPGATATPMIGGPGSTWFGPAMAAARVADVVAHLVGQTYETGATVILPWEAEVMQ